MDVATLIEASKSELIDFSCIPSYPIPVNKISSMPDEVVDQIVKRFNKHGFVIIQLMSDPPVCDSIHALGEVFQLGDPFIPPLYTKGGYKAPKIAIISTKHCSYHPTFQQQVGVELHCDGTLQEIGYVKTSILVCEQPAFEGGDSILFNATAAYAELIHNDLDAAIALAIPGSLIRQANMNGCNDINISPVFSVKDGALITAYSVTETDSFQASGDINQSDLNRGVEFMKKASEPGSPYHIQVKLDQNQAIMFFNTKISHGRTPYQNSPDVRRCLYRGLFLEYPQVISKQLDLKFVDNDVLSLVSLDSRQTIC